MERNWGKNIALNKALAAATDYPDDFGDGLYLGWLATKHQFVKDCHNAVVARFDIEKRDYVTGQIKADNYPLTE